MSTQAAPACQGLRVVDASRVLAGPYCGAILADLGADVIRVEHPTQMDEIRSWSPVVDGVAAPFIAVNHSKRGVAIDLSLADGQEAFRRLLATADVFIDNYRPGTLDRFGFGREALKAINPRLIHCSVRAFPVGANSENLPGYEASIQAFTGIMSFTGEEGGEPVRCGPSVVDMGTGMAATIAVLAALRQRDQTGLGGAVEPALLRTATNLMAFQVASYSLGGVIPERRGSGHPSLVPYGAFPTADGPILLAASNDRLWARLWRLIEPGDGAIAYPTLAERVIHRDAVNARVRDGFARWKRQPLMDALTEAGIPAAPVQTVDEYMADPSLERCGVLERLALSADSDVRIAGRLFGGDLTSSPRSAPPAIGQHTDEVLESLGYSADDLARLRKARAVR
jgi:crotonobetainyl-CoA:carnitine CoA-transferase CaiB-like acyl-CoA transferase